MNKLHVVPYPDWHHVITLRWHSCDAGLSLLHGSELEPPEDIRDGHGARYLLPARFSDEAYRALVRRLEPLLGRVRAGYTSEWDGETHIGCLSEPAEEAVLGIQRMVAAFCALPERELGAVRH